MISVGALISCFCSGMIAHAPSFLIPSFLDLEGAAHA